MSTSMKAALGLLAVAGIGFGFWVTADGVDAAPTVEVPAGQAQPTLVEIMQQLETDMERVAHGVWVADFDSIAVGAQAIADHPKVGPEERAQIMEVLGERASGFRQADMLVHNTAVELTEQARAEQMGGVLDALTRLQAGCVSCHTGYRASIQEPPSP